MSLLNVQLRKHRNNGICKVRIMNEKKGKDRLSISLWYHLRYPNEAEEILVHFTKLSDVYIQHNTSGRRGFMEIIILIDTDGETIDMFKKFEYLYKKGIINYV